MLHRLAGRQSAGVVERIVERTLATTTLFAPRLHLTLAPLVRLGGQAEARSMPLATTLAGGAVASRAGVAARPAARGDHAVARTGAPALARALARSGEAAFPPGLGLTLARAGRRLPRPSAGEPLALADRVASRGRRAGRTRPADRLGRAPHRPTHGGLARAHRLARAEARPELHPAFPCYRAPGVITVLVLPFLPVGRPAPGRGLLAAVAAYVNRRRVLAGATRGAGRGIACMLGEAGAAVYCTGSSVRGNPNMTGYFAGRPETIDETAEMVTARGGIGIPVQVDHLVEEQVAGLFERVRREQGRLDLLVNDISEGDLHEWKPFWQLSLDRAFAMFRNGVHSHILTSRYAALLMIEAGRGLIVEIGDGDSLAYRGTLFYDLVKITVSRFAYVMAEELYKHGVTALAVTPGFMRTETILEHFGVTEENWRDGARKGPSFLHSETPFYVGRAVAADPGVIEKSGGLYSSWELASSPHLERRG